MPQEPNREQATNWNEASGQTWVEMQPFLDRMLAPFADIVIENAFPGESRRVLDIGCGAGATTLAMARRLGPEGACVGVDISAPLVALARKRAATEGVSASFIEADAQVHPFEPGTFDAAMSRFGVMFFDDPVAAFGNIRRGMRRGATLAFIAWRSPAENPFMTVSARAVAHLLLDLPQPAPDAPGQFAFAEGERVARILKESGWSEIELQPIDVPCRVEASELLTYATRLGPVGAALRNADEHTREAVTALLPGAFEPYIDDGEASFNAACWLARAEA